MFSDESTIRQFHYGALNVRRPPNERYGSRYIAPKVRNCPSVMIWGGITAQRRAGLHIMPPNTTFNTMALRATKLGW